MVHNNLLLYLLSISKRLRHHHQTITFWCDEKYTPEPKSSPLTLCELIVVTLVFKYGIVYLVVDGIGT